jgi:hypothetical protein
MLSLAGAVDTGSMSQPRNLLKLFFSKTFESGPLLVWTLLIATYQSLGRRLAKLLEFHRQHDRVLASLQRSHSKSQKETVPYQQDIRQEVGWQHGRHACCLPLAGNAHPHLRIQRLGSLNISWRPRQTTAHGQPHGSNHHWHSARD